MSLLNPTYNRPALQAKRRKSHGLLVRRGGGWWTKILAGLAATLATAWLFPALSHQWQDRQKAKELTAALVSQIGNDTSQALVTSSFITHHRFSSSRDPSKPGFNQEEFNRIDLEWRTSSAEVEAQLQAYFPHQVVREWRDYSNLVWGTYRLITDNESARPGTVRRLRELFQGVVPGWYIDRMEEPWKDRPDSDARKAYFHVSQAVLAHRSAVIDEMLRSSPSGFSTRPADLLSDLLPVL